jgi:tetratricopeptide (TPR) repeat protein
MAQPTIDQLFAHAERDADAGNWPAAKAGYLRVLALAPSHADAMLQLSYIESLDGRYRGAREWVLRALAADLPARQEALLELIGRLRTFNEGAALHGLAERLLADRRTPPRVLLEAARQLSILNDPAIALRCAEAALKATPGDPAARLVRAQLLAHQGGIDEAARDIEQVLQRQPLHANGWWMLSRLRKQGPGANHVRQLRSLLRTPGLRPGDTAMAARALHKELDDLGEHEGAWEAREAMCRARRASVRYDRDWSRALVDELVAWRGGNDSPAETGAAAGEPTPIFIVGMHRSGTTLLEQLLDASPEVRTVGELNDFVAAMRYVTDQHGKAVLDRSIVQQAGAIDFRAVGRRYMDGLAWRLGEERFFTDKQPANFLNAGFICQALPGAKILHMVRDPVETCFSNLRELFSGINEYSYDQRELADYFLQYRRLMAHWHATFPGRILDVSYSALTRDPETTMREVSAHCGIGYVAGMSDPRSSRRVVSTASSVQVRETIVRRDTPKWAPYAGHLQPLVRALREGGIDVGEPPAGRG